MDKKAIQLSIIGIITAFCMTTTLCIMGYFAFIQPLQNKVVSTLKENKSLSANLAKANDDLKKSGDELKIKGEELQAAQGELETLKSDVTAKQAEIQRVNAEVQKVSADLKTQTASLDKAKRGIAQLSELDKLFLQYDSLCEELVTIVDNYYIAAAQNNASQANYYISRYNTVATAAETTYTKITNLLKDFREGKY